MKKVAGVLLASLLLIPSYPAYASESVPTEQITPSEINQLNYNDIEKVIQERNPTVKTNTYLIDSATNGYLSIGDTKDDLNASMSSLSKLIKAYKDRLAGLDPKSEEAILLQGQIRSLEGTSGSMDEQMDSLDDTEEDTAKQVEKVKLSVENVNKQIIWNTESLFIAGNGLMNQRQAVEDTILYLSKKNDAIKLQKSLGLVSDLDAKNSEQQLQDLKYQLDQIKRQQDTVRGQVNLLIDQDYNHPLVLVFNNSILEDGLKALDYKKDLNSAILNSYNLQIQQNEIEIKELALKHTEDNDGADSYSYKKAQDDLDIEVTKFDDVSNKLKQSFDQAYNAVQDKHQSSVLEQSRLDNLKTKLSNAQLSHELGLISDLDLTGAKVEYDAQVIKVQSTRDELKKAFTIYQWLTYGVNVF